MMQSTWPIWLAPEPRTPGGSLMVSAGIHLLVFVIGLLQTGSWAADQQNSEDRRTVTQLFFPARLAKREAKTRVRPPASDYPMAHKEGELDREESPEIPPEPRVDLNAMELSFADDSTNELPEVVRSNNGVFALADKGDPSFARYLLAPPDWEVKEVMLDISGRLRFTMSPAEKWTVLRDAARRYSIDLNKYDVSALFEGAYARCLQHAIRERAMAADAGANRRVTSARLAFAAGKSCGIEVVSISTASAL